MTSRVLMVDNPQHIETQKAWAESNGLNPFQIGVPVFVDMDKRVIYATHIVTDESGLVQSIPRSLYASDFGIAAMPFDPETSSNQMDRLTVQREHPLLVDPPEEICV